MRIGAHVSAAGGIDRAIDRAVEMSAETIQIFGSPPQSLNPPKHTEEEVELFKKKAAEHGIGPVFLHAPYLVNLASPKPSHVEVSVSSLILAMRLSSSLGAEGVIFHIGSALSAKFEDVKDSVAASLRNILQNSPQDTKLIIENSAGGGETVGDEPVEIGFFINEINNDRLSTCLDTQHAFATGYDLTRESEIDRLVEELDQRIGIDRLVALHANDSKVSLGSRRDRHENIGQGYIGKEGFTLLKKNKVLSRLPWIVEVPGFKDSGPDKDNLEILRSL